MQQTGVIISVAIAVLLAFVLQAFLTQEQQPPPSDFGNGEMFDRVATRYDMINRVLALRMDIGWRKRMVKIVADRARQIHSEGTRILDVATGTADVAILQANEFVSSGSSTYYILGVDPSRNMLDVGRHKLQQRGLQDRIELQVADSRDLSQLASESFDGATMAFGIRNVPERQQALCEIHRVLRPGAVLAILEFSEPDDSHGILGYVARIFIRHVVPVVGGILSGAPREYMHLQNSIKDFPNPQEFVSLLEHLQCRSHGDDSNETGSFSLDELVQMNFGSVQLYVTTRVMRPHDGEQAPPTAFE
jgi:demethylmenaquinone methyltransferase/2-methoxy-6-polyprenyl-1,4-benzoquinol methylase